MPEPTPQGYRLVRTLGAGADGWVALAVQESVDREVAVKTLYGADPAALARFRREGQALALLVSDRIVRVYDIIEQRGQVSLVLEFVRGGSLAERLAAGPTLTVAERLVILDDVATALTRAHGAGVVHRDVKPANVLLDENGRAKLADFGIARLTAASAAFRTQDGSITATRRYGAPEQLTDPGAETPAVDAYAFGVLARELLAADGAALPTDVARALEAATSATPTDRPSPAALARLLLDAPADCWPPSTATLLPDDATGRTGATRPLSQVLPSAPVVAASTHTVEWVQPPVFVPDRRRPSRPGLLLGVMLGIALVVALLVTVL